ncbi:DUF7534 family protein [Halorussus caseinilyticus]|uniref:Uncharacterized protein n=1 Tax=Halorussus caseinilyticus TaxID=3034025 RepID=A0ABD5WTU6_9EURY
MDWSRLGGAVPDALVISFVLGAILSPPDPFTQLLYVGPTFVVALLALSRYGQRSVGPWWRRYLVFVGGTVVVAIAGGALRSRSAARTPRASARRSRWPGSGSARGWRTSADGPR